LTHSFRQESDHEPHPSRRDAGLDRARRLWADAQAPGPNRQPVANQQPKIQLAILLDTSSSMDGLIDQARQQLWQAVNEFSRAKRDGMTPVLEVAVYEYGNNGIDAQEGHTRQVVGLTRELDKVPKPCFR
jgi:hypothetical protein